MIFFKNNIVDHNYFLENLTNSSSDKITRDEIAVDTQLISILRDLHMNADKL